VGSEILVSNVSTVNTSYLHLIVDPAARKDEAHLKL
jgi:hypothetical protein